MIEQHHELSMLIFLVFSGGGLHCVLFKSDGNRTKAVGMTGPGGTAVQGSGCTGGGNKGGGYGGRGRGRGYGGKSSSSSRSKKPTCEHTQTHGASSSIVALRRRRCFRLSKPRSRASCRSWREKTSAATRKKTCSKRSTSLQLGVNFLTCDSHLANLNLSRISHG
ncbi:hypothetical protein NL676_039781 [Syzygium grande]|nr:hypothetical protein NL676_039781 [Syzygium grande]